MDIFSKPFAGLHSGRAGLSAGLNADRAAVSKLTSGRSTFRAVAALCALAAMATGCSSQQLRPGSTTDASNLQRTSLSQPARSNSDFSRKLYAGVGVGVSRLRPDTSEVNGVSVNDGNNAAGQATIGLDVTRHLSLEYHSTDLGSAGLSPSGRVNYLTQGVSALYYVGKNHRRFNHRGLAGFARAGYGKMENRAIGDVRFRQENDDHFLLGVGMEYMTRIGLGLRAEVISFDEDAQFAQLGMLYRLGLPKRRSAIVVADAIDTDAAEIAPVGAVQAVAPINTAQRDNDCSQAGRAGRSMADCAYSAGGIREVVLFKFDSAQLTPEGRELLQEVASVMKLLPQVQIKLTAHTDSVGSEAYNKRLSQHRADSVVAYLRSLGVSKDRTTAFAYGETRAAYSNATAEGRRLNRRVELHATITE